VADADDLREQLDKERERLHEANPFAVYEEREGAWHLLADVPTVTVELVKPTEDGERGRHRVTRKEWESVLRESGQWKLVEEKTKQPA
jgi:hypothetical protein